MAANVNTNTLRMKKYIKLTLASPALIAIDQFSKYIVRLNGGFYICNANLAFGLKFSQLLLVFILILSAVFFLNAIGNHKSKITNSKQIQNHNIQKSKRFGISNFENWNLFEICDLRFGALIFILSGGVSNLIDRLFFDCVIDFIDLTFWPIFNLADVFITIGGIMIISHNLKRVTHNEN